MSVLQVQDSLQVFPDLKHHSCADAYFYMAAYCARTAPAELLEWAFELCRENMKPMYERVWGWSDNKKRKQIFAVGLRSAHSVRFKCGKALGGPACLAVQIACTCRHPSQLAWGEPRHT